jgi:hypothetical protein
VRRLALLVVAGASVAGVGCGDDGGDPPSALEEQVADVVAGGAEDVRARLETLGVTVERSALEAVEGDDLRCPPVEEPDPGDRATCELALEPAVVLVDVEFAEDGSVSVIGLEVQELAAGDAEVEAAAAGVVAAQVEVAAGEVEARCPGADDPQPGDAVRCRVAVGGGAALPVDLVVDGDGTLALDTAVLDRAGVEAFLADELEGPAEGPVEVSCGAEPVVVSPVDGVVRCEAVRASDGAVFDVAVRVRSLDGELVYEVTPG